MIRSMFLISDLFMSRVDILPPGDSESGRRTSETFCLGNLLKVYPVSGTPNVHSGSFIRLCLMLLFSGLCGHWG